MNRRVFSVCFMVDIMIPLRVIHKSEGEVSFKVAVSAFIPGNGYSPFLDYIPDIGLTPGISVTVQ
jgi:hypothetical protein